MGICALMIVTAGTAAQAQPTPRILIRHIDAMEKHRQVIRFFERHPWLLTDEVVGATARRQLRTHRKGLAAEQRRRTRTLARATREAAVRRLASLHRAPPRAAICTVFGPRYCGQALSVARCESGFRLDARNGQYRGLFQMGSAERRRFGHGRSAYAQATAAHRYFVLSGRDWSPWSCKPW
jgi:hypothetical protein